jgi:thymidylate synthase
LKARSRDDQFTGIPVNNRSNLSDVMTPNLENTLVRSLTIGECWLECIRRVLDFGKVHHDEDVEIREILGLSVEVLHPRCTDEVVDQHGDRSVVERTLAKFSKGVSMPERPFTYGSRIYDNSGADQFEWLVQRLHAKRETKSATICLLIPGCNSSNLPCLTTIDAKIRNNALELQFFFRSQNIFGRQYANLLALAHLQADLAARCSVVTGAMRGYVASAHIYTFDCDEAIRIAAGVESVIRDRYYAEGPRSIRCTE